MFLITTVTVLAIGVLHLILTFRVISHRRSEKIAHGDQNDKILMKKIRAQGNLSEQAPIAIILLALVEYYWPAGAALPIAICLLIGRLLHAYYFSFSDIHFHYRFWGMFLTIMAQILALMALGGALLLR